MEGPPPAPAPEEPRRRWPRIPSALVVTLVGIALSAWLLPALTRQWDDRQKEQELKAAVVGDMASATAQALVGGEAIWSERPLTDQQRTKIADRWALSALEIEARLRSYFPGTVVASWQLYAWAIDRFIDGHRVSAAAALSEVVGQSELRLDPRVSDAVADLLILDVNANGPRFEGDSYVEDQEVGRLKEILATDIERNGGMPSPGRGLFTTWRPLEKTLLRFEQAIADQVIAAEAAGYSTTWHDLFSDLIP